MKSKSFSTPKRISATSFSVRAGSWMWAPGMLRDLLADRVPPFSTSQTMSGPLTSFTRMATSPSSIRITWSGATSSFSLE